MFQFHLEFTTQRRGLINITDEIAGCVTQANVEIGLCHIFIHHTSASLTLCENADPLVQRDLEAFMQRLIPDGDPLYQHNDEGPDDMPSHIRTVLTQSFLLLPISGHQLALGTWQGIYLWEHRLRSHRRKLTVTVTGSVQNVHYEKSSGL
jgi:secondary thiamine-phosphate synthase enzyme